jgi:hypothetical protein
MILTEHASIWNIQSMYQYDTYRACINMEHTEHVSI